MLSNLTKRLLAAIIFSCVMLAGVGCDQIAGRYYYKAGEKLYYAGNYSEAIEAFNASIKHHYQLRESYAMRGLAHYKKGEYDLAISDNNEALAISPDYAPAYNGRGLAYYRKGEMDRTISDMEQVLKYTTDERLREPATKLLQELKAKRDAGGR